MIIDGFVLFSSVTPNWIELLISISPANELKITFWIYLNSNTLENVIFSPNSEKSDFLMLFAFVGDNYGALSIFERSLKRKYNEKILNDHLYCFRD